MGSEMCIRDSARAQVGGKMAQVGSRLIDAAAAKVAEDFFKAFEVHLRPAELVEAAPAAVPAGGNKTLWWVVGAAIVLGLIYLLSR